MSTPDKPSDPLEQKVQEIIYKARDAYYESYGDEGIDVALCAKDILALLREVAWEARLDELLDVLKLPGMHCQYPYAGMWNTPDVCGSTIVCDYHKVRERIASLERRRHQVRVHKMPVADEEFYKDKHFWIATGITWGSSFTLMSATNYTERGIPPNSPDTLGLPNGHAWNAAIASAGAGITTGLTMLTRKFGEGYCTGEGGPPSKFWCFMSRYAPTIGYSSVMFIGAGRRWSTRSDNAPLI